MNAPATVTVPVKVWAQVGDAVPAIVASFDWTAPIGLGPAEIRDGKLIAPLIIHADQATTS